MRSMIRVVAPLAGLAMLLSAACMRQAQAEEQAHARFEAAIAEREPPPEVQGTLADGAGLARQILSLRGQ